MVKDRVFRDPVHGLIEFVGADADLSLVLETPGFQRLRRVHQMGFAWQVYPGAEHSRFGHALGAYHIAQRVAAELKLDDRIRRHVCIAALLHDIGHGPFSHSWEQAFASDHEQWGARIVAEHEPLRAALEALEPDLAATMQSFWRKTYEPAYARKLVSSQLDVDRLDYLLRDAHYSGAGYATFDLDWILHALRIEHIAGGAPGGDLVIDYRRGMYAVEQYLFARSYMYAQVYHHKTVRACEWMFLKLLARFGALSRAHAEPDGLAAAAQLARGAVLSVDDYLSLDDVAVMGAIDRWCGRVPTTRAADDPVLRDLASRIAHRRLFKTIDLGDDPRVIDAIADGAREIAHAHFGDDCDDYYVIDATEKLGYSMSADDDLFVVGHPRVGTVTLREMLSDVPLGRPLTAVRIVCAPELLEPMRRLV